jgi:excisionase family DNA binding protein
MQEHAQARNAEFMTLREAADLMRVSVRTLCRYIDAKRIPSCKLPGRRLVKRVDVLGFMDAMCA